MQAREGLLLPSGWEAVRRTSPTKARPGADGALDLDFRLGYGFSDRFQLFMDFAVDAGRYPQSADFASWTFTIRGQTVLIGDRAGKRAQPERGVGVGGVDYTNGLLLRLLLLHRARLSGGLSYDARVTPWFAAQPRVLVNWHRFPTGGFAATFSTYGSV